MTFWTFWLFAALLSLSACRRGVPVIGTSPHLPEVPGTISGTVLGLGGAVDGRAVEAVNVGTGVRQRTTTNTAGGFTFRLEPGKYRVDLRLRDGERLIKEPGVIDVNRRVIDANVDFVLGASGMARPRYRAPRADDGLGSAIS